MIWALILSAWASATDVKVGAKIFTEGFVLGEYTAQTLEAVPDVHVTRRFGLGGTGISYQALLAGEVDVYPEYTGTIAETILNDATARTIKDIATRLLPLGLVVSPSLGFSNNYAIAVTPEFARANRVTSLSGLKQIPGTARVVFSSEFMSRADGYPGLKRVYDLNLNPRSLEHSLAFEAVRKGEADVIDVYSTDAKINKMNLILLKDDRHAFPPYEAVLLARQAFVRAHPDVWQTLLTHMAGHFSAEQMRSLNAMVDIEKRDVRQVAASARGVAVAVPSTRLDLLGQRTREHLILVLSALLFSVALGLPLGILADRNPRLGQVILLLSGTIQTIPSLALLCFLIPVFGIGLKPALVALCLYGLLPVVLNTVVGLANIDPQLRDTAKALGLTFWHRLWFVELPLASPYIMAGIKTSAIVGIGTATLAALIGAGGFGASIVSGLAINDTREILFGAVPAAGLSLAAYGLFFLAERWLIPRGLR